MASMLYNQPSELTQLFFVNLHLNRVFDAQIAQIYKMNFRSRGIHDASSSL
jgi:hypothetical protein